MKYFAFIIFILFVQSIQSQTADLTVIVTNIKNDEGKIKISLFTKDNFLQKGKENQVAWLQIDKLAVKYTFKNIPFGEYAVSVFHDENNDGIINRKFIVFPAEGTGFSNNYHPNAKPNFNSSKIKISENKTEIIKLEY